MMDCIRFSCPACFKVFRASIGMAEAVVRCSKCGAKVVVPAAPVETVLYGIPLPADQHAKNGSDEEVVPAQVVQGVVSAEAPFQTTSPKTNGRNPRPIHPLKPRHPVDGGVSDLPFIRTQRPLGLVNPYWIQLFALGIAGLIVGSMCAGLGMAGGAFGQVAVGGETRHTLALVIGGFGGLGAGMILAVMIAKTGRG